MATAKQLRCVVCGDKASFGSNRIDSNFFKCKSSQKTMYPHGYFTTCKNCCEKQVTDELGNLDRDKLIYMLKSYFDRPFIESIYLKVLHEENKKNTAKSKFREYMRRIAITYKMEEGFEVSELNDKEENDKTQLKNSGMTEADLKELRVIWGDYSPNDLTFLKLHLNKLLGTYECSTPIQESLYMNICRAELQARKCLEGGDVNGYEKAVKIVSMLSGDLQIKPSSKKEDSAGASFGMFMAQVEQIMPIPEPLPIFKDVNRIKKYFDVFFVRQIARMLGKTDVPVEEDFNESWD